MTKKEIEVLLLFIESNMSFEDICKKLDSSNFCKTYCTGKNDEKCIREYAKVMVKEREVK